ncbi:hypothetical protein QE364_001087 [Nocardioides zeae]|uniref:Uncharacterized protein n=2 Tax=Nocardioides zeae TaxID=1457234 RepID=A0AAJ1U639_9ACTN|nr:hypothetical protein [Nocardioides zeae]MDQ1103932.1 hypothetical protein [Nocardioides zeae]MDR6176374.1 hypothetical protein [Nocardioides zeae]MDR6209387.1 hypothetical protein [Nocardioides zeae]
MTDLVNNRQRSRWSRRPSPALAVLGGTALVVGGFVAWRALPPAPDAELDGLRVLTDTTRPGGGMDALMSGELVAAGGCVGVESDGFVTLVVWPRGTKVEDGAVVTPGGTRARLGEQLELGGGGIDVEAANEVLDPEIPGDCLDATTDVFLPQPDE